MSTLPTLHGVQIYVSGVPGHFVEANRCTLRLHYRIGNFRVSTVGGLYRDDDQLAKIGADRWSETMVFPVRDLADAPEGELVSDIPLAVQCVGGPCTRAAERLHHAIADLVARAVSDDLTTAELVDMIEIMGELKGD